MTGTALQPARLAAMLGLVVIAVLLLWAMLSGIGVEPGWLELTPAKVDAFVAA